MNYSQFVKQENFENAYTFVGDSFLMQKVVDFFIKKFALNSYDISYFDADNFSCDKLIESCEQVSFFAKSRLVVVKNLNSLNESDKKKLVSYTKQINPNCTLLMYDSFNKGLFNLQGVQNIELSLYDNEIVNFVQKSFASKGKQIKENVVQELISCCNKDLNTINNEITKLCAYKQNESEITTQDISLLVPANEEIVIFELTTALGEKNSQKAVEILHKLMGNVEQNSKLFSLWSTKMHSFFMITSSGSNRYSSSA